MKGKGHHRESHEGVPQGSPLSPLLSNIALDVLDKALEKRRHKFADFIILVKSLRAGRRVLASITRFVEKRLKLRVHDQKSQVAPVIDSKFLGFNFKG